MNFKQAHRAIAALTETRYSPKTVQEFHDFLDQTQKAIECLENVTRAPYVNITKTPGHLRGYLIGEGRMNDAKGFCLQFLGEPYNMQGGRKVRPTSE